MTARPLEGFLPRYSELVLGAPHVLQNTLAQSPLSMSNAFCLYDTIEGSLGCASDFWPHTVRR